MLGTSAMDFGVEIHSSELTLVPTHLHKLVVPDEVHVLVVLLEEALAQRLDPFGHGRAEQQCLDLVLSEGGEGGGNKKGAQARGEQPWG